MQPCFKCSMFAIPITLTCGSFVGWAPPTALLSKFTIDRQECVVTPILRIDAVCNMAMQR
jgi:hypothetical protein